VPRIPSADGRTACLDEAQFDVFVEGTCAAFCADVRGRPGLPPGRYFRLLLLGYFEGLDSERAIAWRVADSLSVRSFLDLELHEPTPTTRPFLGRVD